MKFREGQKEYSGKKGIGFLMFWSEGSLKIVVYFTIICWCDQDAKDVLSISKEVMKEFVESQPQIKIYIYEIW